MPTFPRLCVLFFGILVLDCGGGSRPRGIDSGSTTGSGTSTSTDTVTGCADVKALCDRCPVTGPGCQQALTACDLVNDDRLGCCKAVADRWRTCPGDPKVDSGAVDAPIGPADVGTDSDDRDVEPDTVDAPRPGAIQTTVRCAACCPGENPDGDPPDQTCGSSPTPGEGENVCDRIHLDPTSVPPRVVFVQDVSSSMKNQWKPLHDAMVSVAEQFGDRMLLGFAPFASVYFDRVSEIRAASETQFQTFFAAHDDDCDISDSSIIAPSETSAAQVIAAYDSVDSTRMVGATPTYAAMEKVRKILVDDAVKDGSPRYAILVTDGAPNCASPTGDSNVDVETSIRKLAAAGVSTFVVGYNYTGEALDQWAKAGNTLAYIDVSNTGKLGEAISGILVSVLPCQFALSAPVARANDLRIIVNTIEREFNNPADGWTLGSDGKTITLTGQACSEIRTASQHSLEVIVACADAILE